jgi:hypothetical protein
VGDSLSAQERNNNLSITNNEIEKNYNEYLKQKFTNQAQLNSASHDQHFSDSMSVSSTLNKNKIQPAYGGYGPGGGPGGGPGFALGMYIDTYAYIYIHVQRNIYIYLLIDIYIYVYICI